MFTLKAGDFSPEFEARDHQLIVPESFSQGRINAEGQIEHIQPKDWVSALKSSQFVL